MWCEVEALKDWCAGQTARMVEKTMEFAAIESPSLDAAAQELARKWLAAELERLGFEVRRLDGRDGCDHLLAGHRDAVGETQLLVGHLDTVWPLGTLGSMPLEERDGELHGPGVLDMKGGIVQALFALECLVELGLEPAIAPVFMVAADEEIGSPDSRRHTVAQAAEASRVFVLEPAYGPTGALKTTRKGVGRFHLTVRGVASHAGLDPEGGVSAVLEVSRQIERLFDLNDPSRGVTVNVGTIDGGLRPNVIAPKATAEIETRVVTAEDAEEVQAAILSLAPTRDRIKIEIEGGFDRPPMEKTPGNAALWARAKEAAAALGFELGEAHVGGASDGNLTSQVTPTLDGMGAVGDGAHADFEHLIVARMAERAALLATLLLLPAR